MSSRGSGATEGSAFPPCCHHERSALPSRCASAAGEGSALRAVALTLALLATRADAQKLYITNQVGATITVVDQQKLVVDTTIDLKTLGFSANAKPHHTAVEPDGSFWYATLIGDGKVLKFDRANKLVGRVSMETPGLLAIDPAHDSLYVGRSMTAVNPPKSLGIVKRSSFELVDEQEIQIPRPHALVVTRDGKWVHAASLGENRIASLETATGRVTLSTLPGTNFRSMVQFTVSPDGKRLVVGGEISNSVMTFDLGGRPPLAPKSEVAVAGKPWDPVFSPDGKRAYFSLFADSAVAELDVTGAAPKLMRTMRGGLSQPYDMIMRADGKYLFVVNQNLAPLKPGASAHDAMHGPSTATPATGYLSVIDVASGKVVKTLMLGAGPTGMGAAGAR